MKSTILKHYPKNDIDFSKRQLLISITDRILVVMSVEDKNDNAFEGIVVKGNGSYEIGNYLVNWSKDCFEKLNGSITLEND